MDALEIDAVIVRRIKDAKKRAGVTLPELGEVIGVSGQQMGKYLSGKNRFKASDLVLLTKFLGIEMRDVFRRIDNA